MLRPYDFYALPLFFNVICDAKWKGCATTFNTPPTANPEMKMRRILVSLPPAGFLFFNCSSRSCLLPRLAYVWHNQTVKTRPSGNSLIACLSSFIGSESNSCIVARATAEIQTLGDSRVQLEQPFEGLAWRAESTANIVPNYHGQTAEGMDHKKHHGEHRSIYRTTSVACNGLQPTPSVRLAT